MPLYWRAEARLLSSTYDIIFVKEGRHVPRRGAVPKRDVLQDPLYNSKLVTRLINNIMVDGKRSCSKIVYGAFNIIREKTGREPLEVFEEAMENIMPNLEVKARRVGGATYQVPIEVRADRRQTLGLRWLTGYSRLRSEKPWLKDYQLRFWMLSMVPAQLLKSVRILTKWQKPTKRLRITDGNRYDCKFVLFAYATFLKCIFNVIL